MVFGEEILEIDDSFTNGKSSIWSKVEAGSKQAGFGVPFVITYHPKLKKIMKIM